MSHNQTIDGVSRKSLEQALKLAAVFDDGGDGADAESARGVVWILRALLDEPAPAVNGEQWYADTPDGDSALVTRVAALCNHPSMSFHQVALLEGAISESKTASKQASQPQGEPVAWTEVDVLDFISVALRHAEYSGLSPSDILDGLRYMAEKGKPAYTVALPAPVAQSRCEQVPFSMLCYGAKFKYTPGESAVFVKIGPDLVAGWDGPKVADGWSGQPVCSFSDDGNLLAAVTLVHEQTAPASTK